MSLEWNLSYEDIRLYRSLAKSELRKENAYAAEVKNSANANENAGSWTSWIWGASNTTDSAAEPSAEEEVSMTEEQRQELYEAIEWDEKQIITSEVEIPKDRVTMQVEASLNTGSFKLRRDPHGAAQDIALVLFNGFQASYFQRPDSFCSRISLQEFQVDDRTNRSLYEQVVSVKSLDPTSDSLLKRSAAEDEADPFFSVFFENNPLDEVADSKLHVKLKSMTVFYNTLFLESILHFFKPPKMHLETIGAIMNAAGVTVQGFRHQTRIGLEYALQEHKTVDVKMDLQAPLIVIPLDVTTWQSPCAIIDAGHISVVSDLVSKDMLEEVNKKRSGQYNDDDWQKLESLMYDKFNLSLHDTQILIGANVRESLQHLKKRDSNNPSYIIDRLNMDFVLEISILPDALSLTRFKLSGTLPLFRASMSDAKYKIMMQIIDRSIPNFDLSPESSGFELTKSTPTTNNGFAFGGDVFYDNIEESFADDDDTSVTAPASKENTAKDIQKVFEFRFKVDKVEMHLHRCRDFDTLAQEPLVDMTLEHFDLAFYYKSKEIFTEVMLSQLNVEDFIDKTSSTELRQIATSNHKEKTDSELSPNADYLFKVKYWRLKRDEQSPSLEDINDQYVEVTMSTIKFVLEPRSSLTMLDFIITTFTNPNPVEQIIVPEVLETSESTGSKPTDALIDVKVNMKSIILLLNDEGSKLASFTIESATSSVLLQAETMKFQCSIASLSLYDLSDSASNNPALRQLIGLREVS